MILVGSSCGSFIALMLAAGHPGRCAALALGEPPAAQVAWIADAGHGSPGDNPAQLHHCVFDFLSAQPACAAPELAFVYEAVVDVGERRELGATAPGQRFMVDILGGRCDGPSIRARVLRGGADRLWLRPERGAVVVRVCRVD